MILFIFLFGLSYLSFLSRISDPLLYDMIFQDKRIVIFGLPVSYPLSVCEFV